MAIETWEEFPIGPNDAANQLHVTLSKKGEILVGAVAFRRLGRPEAAVLLYDRTNSRIGLMPSHPRVANAYPLKPKSNARHRLIRANRFCRHYGIKVDRVVAFVSPKIDDDGTLVLDLRKTTNIGRPPGQNRSR